MPALPELKAEVRSFWRVYRITEDGLVKEPKEDRYRSIRTEFVSPEDFRQYLELAPKEFGNDYPNGEYVLLQVFSRSVTEER